MAVQVSISQVLYNGWTRSKTAYSYFSKRICPLNSSFNLNLFAWKTIAHSSGHFWQNPLAACYLQNVPCVKNLCFLELYSVPNRLKTRDVLNLIFSPHWESLRWDTTTITTQVKIRYAAQSLARTRHLQCTATTAGFSISARWPVVINFQRDHSDILANVATEDSPRVWVCQSVVWKVSILNYMDMVSQLNDY